MLEMKFQVFKCNLSNYQIIDEQHGGYLGILLLPVNGSEMTLAFEDSVTDTQKQIIIGTSAFIVRNICFLAYFKNKTYI